MRSDKRFFLPILGLIVVIIAIVLYTSGSDIKKILVKPNIESKIVLEQTPPKVLETFTSLHDAAHTTVKLSIKNNTNKDLKGLQIWATAEDTSHRNTRVNIAATASATILAPEIKYKPAFTDGYAVFKVPDVPAYGMGKGEVIIFANHPAIAKVHVLFKTEDGKQIDENTFTIPFK